MVKAWLAQVSIGQSGTAIPVRQYHGASCGEQTRFGVKKSLLARRLLIPKWQEREPLGTPASGRDGWRACGSSSRTSHHESRNRSALMLGYGERSMLDCPVYAGE